MTTPAGRDDWRPLPATGNADWFEIRDDLIAIVPRPDARDTEESARESIALQQRHWRSVGRRGGVVVFMDNLLDQDSGARAVYMNESDPATTTCYALVGESMFAQAVASVFTGLSRPRVPTRMFRSLDDALPWIDEMNRTRGGPL
jgi:hypothetical protein